MALFRRVRIKTEIKVPAADSGDEHPLQPPNSVSHVQALEHQIRTKFPNATQEQVIRMISGPLAKTAYNQQPRQGAAQTAMNGMGLAGQGTPQLYMQMLRQKQDNQQKLRQQAQQQASVLVGGWHSPFSDPATEEILASTFGSGDPLSDPATEAMLASTFRSSGMFSDPTTEAVPASTVEFDDGDQYSEPEAKLRLEAELEYDREVEAALNQREMTMEAALCDISEESCRSEEDIDMNASEEDWLPYENPGG
jgi:hypothetical protein